MKNKKLTILMAEFMGVELLIGNTACYIVDNKFGEFEYEYNPCKNPAQMNAFIEHPDVMMDVFTIINTKMWCAKTANKYEKSKHRPTAINKCAAAFLGEEFEI